MGNACLIDGMIDRFNEETGKELNVYATGGLSRTIIPHCKHEIIIDEGIEPTCTEEGLTRGEHCFTCNKVLEAQEEIESLGHIYEIKNATESVCEQGGKILYECMRCKDTYEEEVPAKGQWVTLA